MCIFPAATGSWLQQRRRRYDVIIATKVAGRSAGLPWIPANRSEPRGAERNPVLDAAAVRSACEAELRRLKTDYVDLYQLHWPDRYLPSELAACDGWFWCDCLALHGSAHFTVQRCSVLAALAQRLPQAKP